MKNYKESRNAGSFGLTIFSCLHGFLIVISLFSVLPAAAQFDNDEGPEEELIETKPSDTVVEETEPYSARTTDGAVFYHKRAMAHSPQPSWGPHVIISKDTASLADTFLPCPICFQVPVTEADYILEELLANQISGFVEFRYRKLDSDVVSARLQRIGNRFIPHLDRSHLNFQFTPLHSTIEQNAIACGNGHIYFTSALLDIMEGDEEVAAVLAHEMSHAEFRHVLENFKLSQKLSMITAIISGVLSKSANLGGLVSIVEQFAIDMVMNGFSRGYELEADAGARWLLTVTDQDTRAMSRVLLKLDDLYRDVPDRPTIMASHPEESDRIKAFNSVRVFDLRADTGDMGLRVKFQRRHVVGLFSERAAQVFYATLYNNRSDTDIHIKDFDVSIRASATDTGPEVKKIKVVPSGIVLPRRSYGQIKIMLIAAEDLDIAPDELNLTAYYMYLDDSTKPKRKEKSAEEKKAKRGRGGRERTHTTSTRDRYMKAQFHFDLKNARLR